VSPLSLFTLLAAQELQVQEGGDVTFLAADYQALLTDTASAGSQADQHIAAKPEAVCDKEDGLTVAVESIKQLFQDCCRFSTGATAAVQRQLPGLEKLLRAEADSICSLQAVINFMSHAI